MRLINLNTGFYEELAEDQVTDAVRSGQYSFDQDDEVTLLGPNGEFAYAPATTALELLSDPDQGYVFKSEESRRLENQTREQESATGIAKTIGEGLARGATVGLSDLVGDPELKKLRREVNPITSTVSEIVGAIAPLPTKAVAPLKFLGAPTRAVDKIGRTAQAAVTKSLRGVSTPAARVSGIAARGATEGALFGVGQTISEDALGDADFNGESLVSNISKGAFFGAGAGAVFGMGSEVARKKALQAKKDASNEIRKAFGVNQVSNADETLLSLEKVERDDLSPKRLVEFFEDAETGKIKHVGKGKTVEIDPENFEGRVFNLYDPNVQEEISAKLGISNLAEKLEGYDFEQGPIQFLEDAILKTQQEAQGQMLAKTKAQQVKLESIKRRMSMQMSGMKRLQGQVTELRDRFSKGDFSVKKRLQEKQGKLGQQKLTYKKAVAEWDEFKNSTVGKTEARNVTKEVNQFMEQFDIIQSGKKFFVQNDNILSNVGVDVFNHAKRSIKKFDISERAILKLIGANASDIKKNSPKQLESLVSYVQGILGKGKISRRNLWGMDEIAQENANILSTAVNQQEEVINQMTNFFADSAIGVGVNSSGLTARLARIARSLETDGLPSIGMTDAAKEIQAYKEEIKRAYEIAADGTGIPKALKMRDIVELRRDVQKKIKWSRDSRNTNPNADTEKVYNEFRVYLNDLIVDRSSKFEVTKGLSQSYRDLNKAMSNSILLSGIIKDSLGKEAVKKGISLSDMFTGTVGISVGNAPAALAMLTAKKSWDAYGNNILGVYGDVITKRANAINAAIKSSALGFTNASRINVIRPATMGLYTLADYEKDKKKIENGGLSPEAFNSSFLDSNAAALEALPRTSLAIQESVIRGNQLLLDKFPKGYESAVSSFTPSQSALGKFDRYKRAIQDPNQALNEFKQGYMTPESIEVMRVVYPKIFRSLREEVLDKITGKKLNYQQRQQLHRVFGIKTNLYQGAQANQAINNILEQQPNDQELTQGQQSRAGKSDSAKQAQTSTQRLMDQN